MSLRKDTAVSKTLPEFLCLKCLQKFATLKSLKSPPMSISKLDNNFPGEMHRHSGIKNPEDKY